jgi:uncharacterized membrane protein YphA (DoxX/SURF4 family)
MKIAQYLISIVVGLLFMVSGILKLYPIEMLELDLGYHTGMPEWLSMVIARLLIGFEMVLGIFLMIRFQEKRTLRCAAFVLIFFSCYLIYLMIQFPSQDNCGCMGMMAPMTPLQSLLKNLGMLGLIFVLIKISSEGRPSWMLRLYKGVLIFVVIGLTLPFVLNHIDWRKDELRQSFSGSIHPEILEGINLKPNETALLAYVSPHCIYCKMLARKWEWLKARNNWSTPIHLVFMGEHIEEDIQTFFSQTGLQAKTYRTMNAVEFVQKTHGSLPSAYLIQNGSVVQKDNFISLNERQLQEVLVR